MKSLFTFALLAAFAAGSFAQLTLPFNETFNSAYSSNFNSSAGTSNAGANYTCTAANGVGLITSADYLTTKTLYVGQGKGVTLSFKLNKGGSFNGPVDVYLRVNDATLFSSSSPANNGWVDLGNATTFSCGINTFTIPSEISGGQRLSFTIDFKGASSTNWVAIEDLSVTETTGATVPTSFTENFTTDDWYPTSGYVKIPYHSNTSASNGYTWLLSNGAGGALDYYAAFYTGFDGSSGTHLITPEINTSGYAHGQLRFAFKAQYPCGGPTSYTFDEDYDLYAPEVYIMEGADNGVNQWVRLPVKYYFPDATWRYATVDISAYKNANVKFKFERGGFCSSPAEGIDNIKVFDRNCTVSSQPAGTVSGPANIAANTDYVYSTTPVTGANYYKWTVRSGGNTYSGAPYIVSGQGTTNVTVNFGNLPAPLRVLCLPYDADPTANSDACYAETAFLSTSSCTPDTASVSIAASTTTICPGEQVDFTATPVNGGSTPTYQWQVNGSNVATGSTFSSTTLNVNDAVRVIMTSSETCITNSPDTSNAITITVNSNGTASVSIAASATAICTGDQVDFTATPVNEGLTPTYQWQVNGGNAPGATNNNTYSSTTLNDNDAVTVIMTSSLTCISGSPDTSNAITIDVTPGGAASVSIAASATTICPGTQVDFTATPTNGGATPAYQWKVNGNNAGTGSTFSSATLADNDVVTVEMTSSASCITGSPATSNAVTITVTSGLTASVSVAASATTICPGTQVDFTATPTNGGTAPTYQWKVNGNNAGTGSTFSSAALNDNDVVTVEMTSNDNCVTATTVTSNPVTITVTTNLTASVSIAASATTVCAGEQVDFTATPTNGGTAPIYQWKVNGNNAGTGSTFSSAMLADNDVVTVEMTSNNGCVSSPTVTSNAITITLATSLPVSVSIAASSTTSCPGAQVDFNATATNGGSNPAYQWKVNGNDMGTNSPVFSTTTLNDGDIVNVEMTSNAGCVSNATAISNSITITVGIFNAGTIVSDKDTLCAWQTSQFILLGSTGGPIRWQSSFSSNNNFNDIPNLSNDTVHAPITIQNTYYRAIVGSGSCADTTGVIVIIVPVSPVAAFTGIVNNNEVTFNSSISQGVSTYHWDFGDGATADVAHPVHLYADSGAYLVCLTVENSSHCTDTLCTNIVSGLAVGIDDVATENSFVVYPNPASQTVQVLATHAAVQPQAVHIFDAVGKRVLSAQAPVTFIDVSMLDNGVYLLQVQLRNAKSQFVKLAVVR